MLRCTIPALCLLMLVAVTVQAGPGGPVSPAINMTSRTVADDFVPVASGALSDLRIWYTWQDDLVGNMSSLHMAIRGDGSGQPGALLWERDFNNPSATGYLMPMAADFINPSGVNYSSSFWFYQLDLHITDPYQVTAGTTYWVELMAVVDPAATGQPQPLLGWKTTAGVCGSPAMQYDAIGQKWCPVTELCPEYGGMDMSFQVVPEPATMTLLGTGLAALLMRRRRRGA